MRSMLQVWRTDSYQGSERMEWGKRSVMEMLLYQNVSSGFADKWRLPTGKERRSFECNGITSVPRSDGSIDAELAICGIPMNWNPVLRETLVSEPVNQLVNHSVSQLGNGKLRMMLSIKKALQNFTHYSHLPKRDWDSCSSGTLGTIFFNLIKGRSCQKYLIGEEKTRVT